MFAKVKNWLREFRLSLRMKMILSLSAIAVVLFASSAISFLEYRRMSSYVSELIAGDVQNIHLTQRLTDAVDNYNLQILAVIGDDGLNSLPDFDRSGFMAYCDSVRASFGAGGTLPLADSVVFAYSAYMLASTELEDVLASNFIDSRDWYFNRLQPLFGRMRGYLDRLGATLYQELQQNSEDFDSGFSRSIIPGLTAVLVGVGLLFLLMFFILVYYVKPLYGMREALQEYLSFRRRYTYSFEGSDQLSELNAEVTELAEENRTLRKRIADLKDRNKALPE